MKTLLRYTAPPGPCGYLPEQTWRLEYEQVAALTPAEYQARLERGWRRVGTTLFRPRCPECTACQSLRVLVKEFRPNRSQRRVAVANEGRIRLAMGTPSLSQAKLALYDRYHAFQSDHKGWPYFGTKDPYEYACAFLENPFTTQEWCYYLDRRLIGVGYVDRLPGALSAIYFFYDPEERHRSLGTWNILCLIAEAARQRIPHVYLGYFVADSASMQYKAKFRPHELLHPDGTWHRADA